METKPKKAKEKPTEPIELVVKDKIPKGYELRYGLVKKKRGK